jgi:hemolysin activation/secretion protein
VQWNERRGVGHIDEVELLSRRRVASEAGVGVAHWQRTPCGDARIELEAVHTVRLARQAEFQDATAPLPRQWRAQADWRCAWGSDARSGEDGVDGTWTWSLSAWTQAAERPFDGSDLLMLGSRSTVRGHDAAQALQGRRITVARVGLAAPGQRLHAHLAWQPWMGWDAGRVDRMVFDDQATVGRSRQAVVLGLRWQARAAGGELVWARAVGPSPVRRHGHWQVQAHWWF